jgi:hypothetical protein
MGKTVKELKSDRILYLTGQIELCVAESIRLVNTAKSLLKERDRLVEHLGYDPAGGVQRP